uniref:Reverse transcriptase domain-containing protein n=1 Tax=Enterobius vermicularis TaxID=51028 RepID=A0A0N4UTU4_ENTVE
LESVIKKFLLRRGTLRFPVQATEFCVEARGKPSYILAIVEVNLDAVIITFEGLERQERIEKCRIRFGKTLEKGSVVEDEVVKLETGRIHWVWPRCARDSIHTAIADNIPFRERDIVEKLMKLREDSVEGLDLRVIWEREERKAEDKVQIQQKEVKTILQ